MDFNVQFNSDSETLFLDDIEVNAIPEPATYALILGGLAIGEVIWKRRRRSYFLPLDWSQITSLVRGGPLIFLISCIGDKNS